MQDLKKGKSAILSYLKSMEIAKIWPSYVELCYQKSVRELSIIRVFKEILAF